MPFDPFFSSANKKHYIPVVGAEELYTRIKAMSREERRDEMRSWRDRDLTRAECVVRRRIAFELLRKRRAVIHRTSGKQITKAIEEFKAGKRDKIEIYGGYNSVSGACGRIQNHAKKS